MATREDRAESVETEDPPRRRPRARAGKGNGRGDGNSSGRRRRNNLKDVTPYTPEDLLAALLELESGDFNIRLPEAGDETNIQIAQAFNRVAQRNQAVHTELARVS